tara:strand:- start:3256 stop:4737 length:1482 start_codon:yes stop_codon:yes gene_type:complete
MIVSGSRVGIGTETPAYTLDVQGYISIGTMGTAYILNNNDTNTHIKLGGGGVPGLDGMTFTCGGKAMLTLDENGLDTVTVGTTGDATDFKVMTANTDYALYVSGGTDRVGIGTSTPDHELTVAGNVSASINISASSFYGDGSNLTGISGGGGAPTGAQYITLSVNSDLSAERVLTAGSGISITDGGAGSTITVATTASPIHAPWISGSTNTYSSMASTTTNITITGANLTSTSVISFDSQFATDGHSIGSVTFNSPTEIVVPITTGTTGGQYTMTITNTDGLSTSVTNAYRVSTHQLYALDSIGKFTSIDDMAYGADSFGGDTWTGIHGTTTAGWNAGCRSVAQINNSDSAYVQWQMDTASPGNASWHLLVGLGYVDDDSVILGPVYGWAPWQWYHHSGGTQVYNGPTEGTEYTNWGLDWTAGRMMRVEVNSGTVTFKYSDNDGASWTTEYTSTTTVDIASNSNLVVAISVYSAHGYAATPENLKIYGSLTNT